MFRPKREKRRVAIPSKATATKKQRRHRNTQQACAAKSPVALVETADRAALALLAVAASQPFIRYDRHVVAGRMAHDYLNAKGVSPKVQFELDGIEHIAQLVAEGFGVSVLPDWPVIGGQDPRLRRWPLPPPCPSRQVGMVWMRGAARSALAEEFVSVACHQRSTPP